MSYEFFFENHLLSFVFWSLIYFVSIARIGPEASGLEFLYWNLQLRIHHILLPQFNSINSQTCKILF